MPNNLTSPNTLTTNLTAQQKAFAARGGYQNGLNPSIVGRIWYVNANATQSRGPVGANGNSGLSPLAPFATVARAFTFIKSYDVIVLDGVIREQVVAPANVYDVTLIGAANTPRQSTSGGLPTGGGATWMPPASGATAGQALLELQTQGWTVSNISFTPHTSSAGIRTTRSASVDATDGSHFLISNCLFNAQGGSGQIGIEDNGGANFGTIEGCRFIGLTTAIKGLNTASNVPQGWRITNNRFNSNTNAIGMSLNQGLVDNNYIRQAANDTNFKVNLIAVSAQGEFNQVINNIFPDAAANVTIAKGYKPGANDVWRNYVTDVAAYVVTVPA